LTGDHVSRRTPILVTVYEAKLLQRLLLCTFMRCCPANSGFFGIQLIRAVGRRRTNGKPPNLEITRC
jgi:hypothetical protein